jgi:putative ABC transport system permease protein
MRNLIFEIWEGLLISLRALRENKARAMLTTLGIVIGIWAVVTMSTALKGIDIAFQNGVASLGSDNLYIDKWAWFNTETPWWELRNRKNLTYEDYEKYKRLAKLPVAIAPSLFTRRSIEFNGARIESAFITASTAEYLRTTNFTFAAGRFFNELESNGGRNVVVLGYEIAKELFPQGADYAVGSVVRLGGKKMRVVGVLDKQGSWVMGDFNPDNQAYIPLEFLFKNFNKRRRRSITINVRAANSQEVEAVKEEAIGIMRRVRGLTYNEKNDFSINQQSSLLKQIDSTVGVIQIAGFFITGLSLFVGAIGIMNIMFVSVKERTREIGIRKAIGAKRRSILGQFIAESSLICLFGGVIGLILAAVSTVIIKQWLPTSIQIDTVMLAFGISIFTGILAGFAPAYTAAKLDPVDALRYE